MLVYFNSVGVVYHNSPNVVIRVVIDRVKTRVIIKTRGVGGGVRET